MKKILFFSLIALLMLSCDKDQKVVKKLDGTWDATSIEVTLDTDIGEITVDALLLDPEAYGILSFENCKIKSSNYCDGTVDIKIADNQIKSNTEYRVIDDGGILVVKDSTGTNNVEILELDDEFCKLNWTTDEGEISLELEKR